MATNENAWSKMPPSEFDLLVLPLNEDEDERDRKSEMKKQEMGKLLAPKEYLLELEKRNQYYSSLKSKVKKGGLSSEMENNLHAALQGHFKEWMTSKGHTKNLNDLVKMLDRK